MSDLKIEWQRRTFERLSPSIPIPNGEIINLASGMVARTEGDTMLRLGRVFA